MTHEELEGYRERLSNILNCTDENIRNKRLITLRRDLKDTYHIPDPLNAQFSMCNPEVAILFLDVNQEIGSQIIGRLN